MHEQYGGRLVKKHDTRSRLNSGSLASENESIQRQLED